MLFLLKVFKTQLPHFYLLIKVLCEEKIIDYLENQLQNI